MAAATEILAAGLAAISSVGSDASATQARTFKATAAQMLNLADEMAQHGKKHDAEAILELLARDPDSNVRNEARFRRALLLLDGGRLDAAAVMLRRILDEKPDAPAVRLKLATVLQRLGHEDSALRELRALSSTELPPNVARFVDRLTASLQATKPLGFQVELALAPDSNINRATRSDTLGTVIGDFTLDSGSQARSGVGAALRGFAQARHMVGPAFGIVARASGEAYLYRRSDFDDVALELSLGSEWRIGRTRVSVQGGVGHRWYGMKPFQRSFRLSAGATRPIDSVSQLRFEGSARWTDNHFNHLQTGHGQSAQVHYERALSADLLLAANAGVDRFNATDAAYSTRAWTAGVAAYRTVGRTTLSAGADFGRLQADDRLALLPKARADRLVRVTFGAVLRRFTLAGFAPTTRLVIERNKSTVEFYDFRRVRTEFGFSRAF